MTKEEKTAYEEAVALELVRAMELQRKDLDLHRKEDAAVYAMWYLLNPMSVPGRKKVELQCECREGKEKRFFRFTAHAHPNEPLEPSPDDMLIYDTLRGGNRAVHYLIDRFFCRRLL